MNFGQMSEKGGNIFPFSTFFHDDDILTIENVDSSSSPLYTLTIELELPYPFYQDYLHLALPHFALVLSCQSLS